MTAPLSGFVVGITGDRRWEEQAEMLVRRGAQVRHGPVMTTGSMQDSGETLAATAAALSGPIDVVVLTTGIGTRSWFAAAESAGLDDALRAACAGALVVARGPKARSAAIANGLDVCWQAPGETGEEVVEHLLSLGVAGRRVVVQRDGGEPLLASGLHALGGDVTDVPVYRWHVPEDTGPACRLLDAVVAGRLHAVTFTCAYAVRSAFALTSDPVGLADALNGPVRAVAVGPVTTAALRGAGVASVVEPRRPRLGAMVQALVADLSDRHVVLHLGDHQVRWQGDLLVDDEGRHAVLTRGERRVLTELLRRAPAVVPKRDLVDDGADPHAAEVAVARLRAKLGPLSAGIGTIPRRGYVCHLASHIEPGVAESAPGGLGNARSRV